MTEEEKWNGTEGKILGLTLILCDVLRHLQERGIIEHSASVKLLRERLEKTEVMCPDTDCHEIVRKCFVELQ